ncbi:TetR family transcriptional regulator [Curtobacterium caseinilyticum]|uniref:TetR family transcriptional regulator n=1 Tax=Curtobacterium caseinilyticum TaxID=3055137 RepID=A0ABT7TNV6_9MICO|nr:TetR family transcriptional regulator [Curtobacterium caseinilyticum]MDM7891277.1 TetR family transcriptional regulator [Curtobacterium caseinilyticum]
MSTSPARPTGRPRTIDPEVVSLVALRMFDEQGFDTVSMDDVAEAAGVSRRSLFRLFPSKAHLVWGGLSEFAERFETALAERPADEPSIDALRTAYRAGATFPPDAVETTRHRLRVIRANPGLAPGGAEAQARLTETIVRFVADHDGLPDDDLRVAVRASTFAAAANAAMSWWAEQDDGLPADAVDRALAML